MILESINLKDSFGNYNEIIEKRSMADKAMLRFLYMCLLYRAKSLWYLSKVGLKIYLSESRKSTISSAQNTKQWVGGVCLKYMFSLSLHHTSFVLTKCSPCRAKTQRRLFCYEQVENANCKYPFNQFFCQQKL